MFSFSPFQEENLRMTKNTCLYATTLKTALEIKLVPGRQSDNAAY